MVASVSGRPSAGERRAGHEAWVGRADSGSRQVVVAMVVVVDHSLAEGIVSCARVVVGAVGSFRGDASSRNKKSDILPLCLLVGGVLFRPLAIRHGISPGHRGYNTPGSQKAPSAKRCIKTGCYRRTADLVRSVCQKAPSAKRRIKTE